ncbi:MAG: Chaperone protein clpB [Ilumatobacteraceae bacterium]|nr:Chaperone protein clpB [Ilumatobacteraceae bacterium]
MIGRTAALERLRTVVEMAELHASDLPTVALIAGEAGIGKTRLLREMLTILPRDVTVFSAVAEPRSLGHPFDVADQLSPGIDVVEAVAAAALKGRVAVVVEDLHWIDSDSVNVIDAIARQPLPNVVLFATYRPSELSRGAPGGDLVLRLERRNEVDQFRLDRLDRAEVAMLIAAIIGRQASSAAVEAVHRRSGGVPFVVEELLRFAGPDACSDDIVEAQLPWSLEEAVRQQVSGLNPQERCIVEVLAVLGQPAGFEELVSVTGFDERELLVHLRALVSGDVVEETRNDRLWFGHALLAESIIHQLLGRERRRLHEACFETISRLAPDDFAALAHHANGAGRYEDIVPIARQGARAYLDRGATFQALRLATAGLGEDPDDPSLLSVATEAAWRMDFLPEAAGHAHNWVRTATTMSERIDAMRYAARIGFERGRAADAKVPASSDPIVADLMALAGSLPDGADRARAEAAVAQLLMMADDDRAVSWAERAIVQAEAAGDKQILVQARLERASAQHRSTQRAVSLSAMHDVIDDARAIGDGVLLTRALNNTLNLLAPHSAESGALRDELRTTAAAFGFDKLGHLNVMWWDAVAAEADGDLATYRRLLDEWANWTPLKRYSTDYLAVQISLAAEEGRVADGLALSAEGTSQLGCTLDGDRAVARLNLAAVAQDPVAGRIAFEQFVDGAPLMDNWFALGLVLQAVGSSLEVGIPVTEIRQRLIASLLADHPARAELVGAAEGPLALAEGDFVRAIEHLGTTLSTARDCMPRSVEGSLHLALAQASLSVGDRAGALVAAHAAVATLAKWPGWRRDRAEAMLGRLQGSTVRPIGDLTARESEVSILIAEGLTNAQLAERLFISPKTAAVHVSNILAKLGLSSRTEIAAWQIRRDRPITGERVETGPSGG